jgi:heme exporter protein CcmD
MLEFDKYGPYVLAAYIIAGVALAGMALWTIVRHARAGRQLSRVEKIGEDR